MSGKYDDLISDIIDNVGGQSNIADLYHCQTRLRFVLNDFDVVDVEKMKSIQGVTQVVVKGGQCQVIIGTHVKEVFDAIKSKFEFSSDSGNGENPKNNSGLFEKAIDFISGTFSPIIPAIAGAGMVKALLALLLLAGLVTRESQSYYIVNFMADAVFYFLPMLLAYSAATKLKCSPVIATVLGGILLHPSFAHLKSLGDPVEIFNIPVRLVNYGSSVVPILLIVWLQSYVERYLNKIVPNAVKIIFVPMLTIFSVGIVGLTLLGPLGGFVGDYIAVGFNVMQSFGGWTIVFLIATFWPILVMFGIHYSITPLSIAQITTMGVENIIGPGAMLANVTQGVAALIVSRRTTDSSTKQIANSSGITALMGITEPALYGVNIPKKYPLVAGMIGSACGGLYAGLADVYRYATGASGLPAIPLYIGENIWNLFNILIALVIAVVVTGVLTYVLSLKYEKKSQETKEQKNFEKMTDDEIIFNPVKGKVIPLSSVSDEAFASEALGPGIAIEPVEGKVVAPFDCTVVSLLPSKHAVCLESDNGTELLIHVGIDTVSLQGKHFETHVEEGQKVKSGQLLISFDMDAIANAGFSLQTPIIVTNLDGQSKLGYLSSDENHLEINEKLLVLSQA
ncbi:beta-glucoside-specific PTS transporter subunit IIABC [Vibrio mangrovi]|uniref:Beta-glucoside-specific PTS transporter subunit IIABC n=1 Tax=Vibrio mangrovi TaxID=474394 RepID=A0A1Y6ITW0_9VIBR|nr:beta-glucoside-specific PTS transporter subunit IIABC [Vibrio mangrovi]MDW6004793.1 beta-glucoside-specific PTS transporter subunit IIABC [Vibrio mangrovi]SMS01084.1 PTS system beta-glucoside-specific EIIBCA component [Vibrio mangrovi]